MTPSPIIPVSSSWEVWKINKSVNFCPHHAAYWAMASVHSSCIVGEMEGPSKSLPCFCTLQNYLQHVLESSCITFVYYVYNHWINLSPFFLLGRNPFQKNTDKGIFNNAIFESHSKTCILCVWFVKSHSKWMDKQRVYSVKKRVNRYIQDFIYNNW
jgi:hypothetical protein